MRDWQEKYISNVREAASLFIFSVRPGEAFEAWYAREKAAGKRMEELKRENIALLSGYLFPALDDLFAAGAEDIRDLEAFADQLMDWKTNLDCGVYTAIHEALLNMNRIRKERDGVIRELYRLGMGLYYFDSYISRIPGPELDGFRFRNEMVFTEAASYFRFFEEIDDRDTRGYIIRAMANIALCVADKRRKVDIASRILQVVQDPYYRNLEPELPWDTFMRRTHQQMSANRSELTTGNFSREEIAAILDSCHAVFRAEEAAENPSVRWLWPYYEMEYSCGYVGLDTTLDRLEMLITRTPLAQHDMDGLYGNVQLVQYYSHLLLRHSRYGMEPERMQFLLGAYDRLLESLMTFPADKPDNYLVYILAEVITNFIEVPGGLTYRTLTTRLMQRYGGDQYIRSRKAGRIMREISRTLLDRDPAFFDELPVLQGIKAGDAKRETVLEYAESCGLYHAFGLIKMSMSRLMATRNLFENEDRMYRLHCLAGFQDLRERESTAVYADTCLGYRAWYNGMNGYPETYERRKSLSRLMTDVAAVAAALLDPPEEDPSERIAAVIRQEGTRFSPMVTSALSERNTLERIREILRDDGKEFYLEMYSALGTKA